MKQLITPTPWIPATGGWCLMYVRQAYGLPARYASATEAWDMSESKHRDRNFPEGLWTPVWYGIDVEPLGHVVLLAPDGRVYSTSDYSGYPVIHNSLADLEAYYAYYGMVLQYRGWTEDVAGYPVMEPSVTAQSTTPATPKEPFTVTQYEEIKADLADVKRELHNTWAGIWDGGTHKGKAFNYGILPIVAHNQTLISSQNAQIKALVGAIAALSKGEAFDEAKLLAGVQAAAEAGVKSGIESGVIDVNVTVAGGTQ